MTADSKSLGVKGEFKVADSFDQLNYRAETTGRLGIKGGKYSDVCKLLAAAKVIGISYPN